jgi:DNA replication and repair protein RecF
MFIDRLVVEDLRILQSVEVRFAPGLNVFVGANGSGKTSLLEAVHLLGYGRSFRAGGRDALVRRGVEMARVFAEIRNDSGQVRRLGMERSGSSWRGRVNEVDVAQLTDLFLLCPVCCFEPGSHELISGGAELRRSMFDWGVFHVEPDFLPNWRRYQRALRQRNVLLKEQAPDSWFPPWEIEMASAACAVDRMRRAHALVLANTVAETAREILPEFSGASFLMSEGWKDGAPDTPDAIIERLAIERSRDRERGFTRRGPHRADWAVGFDQVPRREYLSRGQEKLTALVVVLSQLVGLQRQKGERPILLLDDLASELDLMHQRFVLDWIAQRSLQVMLTGVEAPDSVKKHSSSSALFHVEQGRVRPHR